MRKRISAMLSAAGLLVGFGPGTQALSMNLPRPTIARVQDLDPDRPRIVRAETAAKAVIASHPEILKIPHVIGTGLTGKLDENNRYTGPEIVVFVDEKENVENVRKAVPTYLEGIPVAVIVVPTAVDL